MPINLIDIRSAVQDYLDTKVAVTISAFRADVPNAIGPGEHFKFDITVANATAANGGLKLINVRYHLKVVSPSKAKLIVNNKGAIGGWVSRSGPLETDPELTLHAEVSEMYLFPYDLLSNSGADTKTLGVGETDTLTNIEGKALSLGATDIQCDIIADVDVNYLIPMNENSTT
ncbi:MAG TPA: hypothetical protein VM866_07575, partial [Pyrinomonadaceae bacterium]|nr:hypothetical protein [Pyrinomonadaceae bacterium]